MKDIPILYSTEMVKAIDKYIKTKTRRTKGLEFINDSFSEWEYLGIDEEGRHLMRNEYGATNTIKCPYGQPGDIHWVRETFSEEGFVGNYVYKADGLCLLTDNDKWKPSIHMPKKAARFFLQVKEVRVERLHDISPSDAIAEGIESSYTVNRNPGLQYKNYYPENKGGLSFVNPIWSFESLWQSINGQDSWKENPWVWVISFERIEKPQNWPL